jgi:hypothetical protein
MPKDIQLARRIRGERSWLQDSSCLKYLRIIFINLNKINSYIFQTPLFSSNSFTDNTAFL